ncbi:MAG: SLBB domain-containing protein [candidate division Zixibacteria bacterium]|nr:SLBB domain-containing protein [candidate division Zixibacteria bacterium]
MSRLDRRVKIFVYSAIILFVFLFMVPAFYSDHWVKAEEESIFSTVIRADEYIVGPGDKFRIDFWNGSLPSLEYTITPEGYLLLASMGRINLGNLTLQESQKRMGDLISKFYPTLEYSVTLIDVRPVKVLVTGAVRHPGLYRGRVSQRVSEMIDAAGGLIDGASQRNITLFNSSKIFNVDILRYKRTGDLDVNPYLYSGYKIDVPFVTDSSSFVAVSGEVINPGDFEYRNGDSLGTMLALAMGLTDFHSDSAIIFRNGQSFRLPIGNIGLVIFPGDKIIVPERFHKVDMGFFSITGKVFMAGCYPLREEMDLSEALKMAGGLAEKANIYSIAIYRRPGYSLAPAMAETLKTVMGLSGSMDENANLPISLDIDKFYPDRLGEVKIVPGDSIVIPVLTGSIGVYGMVNQPGLIPFLGTRISISDLITRAGGYSKGADKDMIQIVRKGSGLRMIGNRKTNIHDGDIVIVPENQRGKNRLKDF